jgi:hypothetical protein
VRAACSPATITAAPDGTDDLDSYISGLIDRAPPLTGEQRDTLALLLRKPF